MSTKLGLSCVQESELTVSFDSMECHESMSVELVDDGGDSGIYRVVEISDDQCKQLIGFLQQHLVRNR